MRWRLILIASLLAAASGATALWLISSFIYPNVATLNDIHTRKPELSFLLKLAVPFAASIYAGIFVYRHTARRRAAQALICVAFTLISCGAFVTTFYNLPSFLRSLMSR